MPELCQQNVPSSITQICSATSDRKRRRRRSRLPGYSPNSPGWPHPGATKLHRLEENIGVADVAIAARELGDVASNIAMQGERYR